MRRKTAQKAEICQISIYLFFFEDTGMVSYDFLQYHWIFEESHKQIQRCWARGSYSYSHGYIYRYFSRHFWMMSYSYRSSCSVFSHKHVIVVSLLDTAKRNQIVGCVSDVAMNILPKSWLSFSKMQQVMDQFWTTLRWACEAESLQNNISALLSHVGALTLKRPPWRHCRRAVRFQSISCFFQEILKSLICKDIGW